MNLSRYEQETIITYNEEEGRPEDFNHAPAAQGSYLSQGTDHEKTV